MPPSSLQRELTSLSDGGLLKREEDGRRVYYQAFLDSLTVSGEEKEKLASGNAKRLLKL